MYETPSGTFILPLPTQADRRITMGVQKHFTGSIVFGDHEGQVMQFESHTEKLTALVMIGRPNYVKLEAQIPFHWVNRDGKPVTHFFDFRVTLRDGTRRALIVKNAWKAAKLDFQADMRLLARQVTAVFADAVSVVTEKHLDPIEVHNAELLNSARLPDPGPDAAVLRVVADISGAVKISDIVAAAGVSGRGFLAVVRLIGRHELELVAHERIEPGVLVRRRFV